MTNSDPQTYYFFGPSDEALGDGGTHSVQRVGDTHTFSDTLEKHPLRLRAFFDIDKCSVSRPVHMMLNEKVKSCDMYLMSQFCGFLVSKDVQMNIGTFLDCSLGDPVDVELNHERLKRGFPTRDYEYREIQFRQAIASSFVNWKESHFALLGAIYANRSPERSLPYEATGLSFSDFIHYGRESSPISGRKVFLPTGLSFLGIKRPDIFHWNRSFFLMSNECRTAIEDLGLTGLRFSGRSVDVSFS